MINQSAFTLFLLSSLSASTTTTNAFVSPSHDSSRSGSISSQCTTSPIALKHEHLNPPRHSLIVVARPLSENDNDREESMTSEQQQQQQQPPSCPQQQEKIPGTRPHLPPLPLRPPLPLIRLRPHPLLQLPLRTPPSPPPRRKELRPRRILLLVHPDRGIRRRADLDGELRHSLSGRSEKRRGEDSHDEKVGEDDVGAGGEEDCREGRRGEEG
mmetsp:Transcript_25034/g.51724  ORF Transcript_25034/g.51724 Transcript_25034/m.51724 type:complete len:213 (+) Transcript_25034:56-694(+)